MSVLIFTQNTLEPTSVPGDLVEVVNSLNLANAKGLDFVAMEDEQDNRIAFRLDSITVMKEFDHDESVFG